MGRGSCHILMRKTFNQLWSQPRLDILGGRLREVRLKGRRQFQAEYLIMLVCILINAECRCLMAAGTCVQ